jgi:hypothetical protein
MSTEISIPNAPWWQNHSQVLLKGVLKASDEAWIQNKMISVSGVGANATVESNPGNSSILKVQRMVQQGTVSVMLKGGQKYEVSLPKDAGELLATDLAYINSQIDALSAPMSAEEQQAFLASANAQSGES